MKASGVDVSKYDANLERTKRWNPDNAKKPIDFAIQRLSYGGKPDEDVAGMSEQVAKILIRGAYHYFSTGITATDQANNFIKQTKWGNYHFYCIDYEIYYNNLNANSLKDYKYVVDYVEQTTGKPTYLYFNPNVWDTYMKPFGAAKWVNDYEIWIAQYPYIKYLDLEKGPNLPKEVEKWTFWQYGAGDVANTAGKAAGPDYGAIRPGIDVDVFNGTVEELRLKFNTKPPEPVQLTLEERVKNLELLHNIK